MADPASIRASYGHTRPEHHLSAGLGPDLPGVRRHGPDSRPKNVQWLHNGSRDGLIRFHRHNGMYRDGLRPNSPPNMLCSPIVQQHSKRFLHGGTDGTLDGNGVPEHPGKPM